MAEEPTRQTMALTVSYDGAPFAGFARQPGHRTVQGTLEDALSIVMRRPIQITCAGRTDSGVHALGQVVSFESHVGEVSDIDELMRSLNGLARPGLAVTGIRFAKAGFSARFDAVARDYRYRIVPGSVPPALVAPYVWWLNKEVDLQAMQEAAQDFVGEHDFRAFCVAASVQDKRTVRTLESVDISQACELGEKVVEIRIVGNAFLHSMVRVIVGSLVEVGKGKKSRGWIAETLESQERALAGPTAPAHGLTFWSVRYPENVWL